MTVELWQLGEFFCSSFALPQPAAPSLTPSAAVLVDRELCACWQCPIPRLGSQHTPSPWHWFLSALWSVLGWPERGTNPSCHHTGSLEEAGRFLRQSYSLTCLSVGICWRGRATRALLSDLRGIWLENVCFCSRLGAI